MVHGSPYPADKPPVESKVKAGAVGAYLGLLALLTVLQTIGADLTLIGFLPAWAQTLIIPLVPGLISYVSGYVARHTPRPDLPQSKR